MDMHPPPGASMSDIMRKDAVMSRDPIGQDEGVGDLAEQLTIQLEEPPKTDDQNHVRHAAPSVEVAGEAEVLNQAQENAAGNALPVYHVASQALVADGQTLPYMPRVPEVDGQDIDGIETAQSLTHANEARDNPAAHEGASPKTLLSDTDQCVEQLDEGPCFDQMQCPDREMAYPSSPKYSPIPVDDRPFTATELEAENTTRCKLTYDHHVQAEGVLSNRIDTSKYADMEEGAYHVIYTSEVDFLIGGEGTGLGISSFGQWGEQAVQEDKPIIDIMIKKDMTAVSYVRLRFGKTVNGHRATLCFPIQTTELHRRGVRTDRTPMTKWDRVTKLRTQPQWKDRIPSEFRTPGRRVVQGQPQPPVVEYLQLFFLESDKSFVVSTYLDALSRQELEGISSELHINRDELLEILFVARTNISSGRDSIYHQRHGKLWEKKDEELVHVVSQWEETRSRIQDHFDHPARLHYDVSVSQPILIDVTTTPWSSPYIHKCTSTDRRGIIPAMPGNFSINDLLHRKIGGVLAEMAAEYEQSQELQKATWNARGTLSYVENMPEYAFMLLRRTDDGRSDDKSPMHAIRAPEADTKVVISIKTTSKIAWIAAIVMEPIVHMQSGDLLLRVNRRRGLNLEDIADSPLASSSPDHIWQGLQHCKRDLTVAIKLKEISNAHTCVLEALSILSHGGSVQTGKVSAPENPSLVWDGGYHPGLLQLATCRQSRLLLVGVPVVFIPHDILNAVKQCFSNEDVDFIAVADGLKTTTKYRGLPLVALIEGWAGCGKTFFLMLLVCGFLRKSRHKIHISAPANLPIDEAIEKLIAFDRPGRFGYDIAQGISKCRIVRGYTESMEWNFFIAVLYRAKATFASMDQSTPSYRQFMDLSFKDSFGTLAYTVYHVLNGVWDGKYPDLPAASPYSLSRMVLRSLWLVEDSRKIDVLCRVETVSAGGGPELRAKLLLHVLAIIRGNLEGGHEYEVITIRKIWLQMAHAIIETVDVLATTPAAGCSALYRGFRPHLAIYDEANKGSVAQWLALSAHIKPALMILCGDRNQLLPSASVGLRQGGLYDSAVSPLLEFAAKDFPILTIYIQRRAAWGLVDAAFQVFYNPSEPVTYIPASLDFSSAGHYLTQDVMSRLGQDFEHYQADFSILSPAMFFDTSYIPGVEAEQLISTGSTTNITNIRVVMGLVSLIAKSKGINMADVAIVCGYTSQLLLYRQALAKLMECNPYFAETGKDLNSVQTVTIDKCEGIEVRVVLFDLCVTHAERFMSDPHRVLVGASRAKDCMIMVGQHRTVMGSDDNSCIKLLYSAYRSKNRVVTLHEADPILFTDVGNIDIGPVVGRSKFKGTAGDETRGYASTSGEALAEARLYHTTRRNGKRTREDDEASNHAQQNSAKR